MRPGLQDLPEPAELHARLTARHPLDWGNPIPTKAELAAHHGAEATTRSLTLLVQAADAEQQVTHQILAAGGADIVAHQLQSRVKSPHSLARKLRDLRRSGLAKAPIDDVLRYTLVTPHPDDLVDAAEHACQELTRRGCVLSRAMHSYTDGNRYKGLHLLLRSHGQRLELQIHSRESIDVKHRTTPLYIVERDREQPKDKRSAARAAAIAISAAMSHPAGIDELKTLGGVPVEVRVYGRQKGRPTHREDPAAAQTHAEPAAPTYSTGRKDGLSR
ncbi:hypothetical protein ACI2LF_25455 [Kribbella sp. NPDC020789]